MFLFHFSFFRCCLLMIKLQLIKRRTMSSFFFHFPIKNDEIIARYKIKLKTKHVTKNTHTYGTKIFNRSIDDYNDDKINFLYIDIFILLY